jgi:membrane-bound ClpP family serine protease
MKNTVKDWLKVTVLLLDEAAAVVVVLLALWYFKVKIPVTAAVIGGLTLGVLIFVIHRAVIPSFHKKQVTGREGMLGQSGWVTETLAPKGTVRIGDETWRAVTEGADIKAGEEIEIVGLNGLTLTVKRKEE